MTRDTILYIYDQAASTNLVSALEDAGYDVVSTDQGHQGIALLFVMHSVDAVILDRPTRKTGGRDLARRLRAIHRGVPIIVLSCNPLDPLPPWVDACVSSGELAEKLTFTLQTMLNHKPAIADDRLSDSLSHAT